MHGPGTPLGAETTIESVANMAADEDVDVPEMETNSQVRKEGDAEPTATGPKPDAEIPSTSDAAIPSTSDAAIPSTSEEKNIYTAPSGKKYPKKVR